MRLVISQNRLWWLLIIIAVSVFNFIRNFYFSECPECDSKLVWSVIRVISLW